MHTALLGAYTSQCMDWQERAREARRGGCESGYLSWVGASEPEHCGMHSLERRQAAAGAAGRHAFAVCGAGTRVRTALTNMASWASAKTTEKRVKDAAPQNAATARQAPTATPSVHSSRALRMLLPMASSNEPPASVPQVPAQGRQGGGREGGWEAHLSNQQVDRQAIGEASKQHCQPNEGEQGFELGALKQH